MQSAYPPQIPPESGSPPRLVKPGDQHQDRCLPIQVDLSAMLDGELDPASVRRAMVHSDGCSSCSDFLDGIRAQLGFHRNLSVATASQGSEELVGADLYPGSQSRRWSPSDAGRLLDPTDRSLWRVWNRR